MNGQLTSRRRCWTSRRVRGGRDQPGVAARAEALGVAVVVPSTSVSAEALSTAVDLVLGDEPMRRRADAHGARLRATNPPAAAADLLETLV